MELKKITLFFHCYSSGIPMEITVILTLVLFHRVPTVREKSGKNEKISRSGKSQGILSLVMEI